MTNLLTVLPAFDTQPYTHILPSLEKALISSADLLTLDAFDVAKRAQVPSGEVKKLASAVLNGLNAFTTLREVGRPAGNVPATDPGQHEVISTLDDVLDTALDGGVAIGRVTEFVGESAAGKTQFLLTLLLSAQLNPPHGVGKAALYISTEAPLQTTRLAQILNQHSKLTVLPPDERPTMARVQSAHIHDLEAQDHILRFQVPVMLQRHDVGLLVIDSIAANYRPEFDKGKAKRSAAESFVKRSNQVTDLGTLLRETAEKYGIAVVVANQVADRFAAFEPPPSQLQTSQQVQKPPSVSAPQNLPILPSTTPQGTAHDGVITPPSLSTDDPLALDHQHRFFTGWGDDMQTTNLKTPSLGLAWTNQLSARVALVKVPIYEAKQYMAGEEPNIAGWKRTFKVVFSEWCQPSCSEFEISSGGVRSIAEQHENGS
ncbi:DNA repair protein rhp57 [Elasticomyces elasticus]|nr:DNA repair protein rhp57 [Elasticomyces elasticus]KAK3645912.1 DNA repair protein rhp57 [Elasticomyces elasticus]KAK4928137.1 DNA repair protein rhp57 [Elasticomyces elasticus]KAK5765889.1 DNA repair protein rhp57 [Elasticomyces elasticus]